MINFGLLPTLKVFCSNNSQHIGKLVAIHRFNYTPSKNGSHDEKKAPHLFRMKIVRPIYMV